MSKLNKYTKQTLIKIFAGITAVCISPMLAAAISKKTPEFTMIVSDAARYVGENINMTSAPHSLKMNNSVIMPYKLENNITIENNTLTENTAHENEIISENTYDNMKENIAEENYNTFKTYMNVEDENEEKITGIESGNDIEAAQVMSRNISDTREDLSIYSAEDGHIINTMYEPNQGTMFINLEKAGQMRNETKLDNETVSQAGAEQPKIKLEMNGEPEVLIMHTHTSEAYQPDGNNYFDSEYTCRSLDAEKSVVAVGAEIAKSLAAEGITVIHDGTVHDSPEYSGSYARSAETVKSILAEYPSIKVVLDIHRDAIEEEDGSRIAAVTRIDGEDAAQVMIISAADDGTYDIPHYMENFKLASLLQQEMESDYPGITRPILFQYCHYNQQLTTGSLLIEVGSHGNSLEQAKYSGKLIGKSIGEALKSLSGV